MKAELTEWQKTKFAALFDLFDNDGNGTVDETEIDGAMERLQVDTGWPEHSRVLSHVTARWKIFLQSLFTDSPLLTEKKLQEYLGRLLAADRQKRSENAEYRGSLEEVAQLLFLLLDRDRNSKIDYDEFLIFFYALGCNDRNAEESFEKLDTDGDGFLQKSEFEDMTLEYFHGAEPGSHGDWLFGPPPELL
jgi:Ca2+-binding EF-hand superfamily protein